MQWFSLQNIVKAFDIVGNAAREKALKGILIEWRKILPATRFRRVLHERKESTDLLSKILKMEEGRVDWAEIQRAQVGQMGMENYLVNQTENAAS